MPPETTISHELETIHIEDMNLADLKEWVKRLEEGIGAEHVIYESGVAISVKVKDRPNFILTQEMVDAGSIQHRYHPYSDPGSSGYYVYVIQRPMTPREQEEENKREAEREAARVAYEQSTFEALKAKGYK